MLYINENYGEFQPQDLYFWAYDLGMGDMTLKIIPERTSEAVRVYTIKLGDHLVMIPDNHYVVVCDRYYDMVDMVHVTDLGIEGFQIPLYDSTLDKFKLYEPTVVRYDVMSVEYYFGNYKWLPVITAYNRKGRDGGILVSSKDFGHILCKKSYSEWFE